MDRTWSLFTVCNLHIMHTLLPRGYLQITGLERYGKYNLNDVHIPLRSLLRPPRGSVKLVSTNLTNLEALEQFNQKPMQSKHCMVVYDVIELLHWHKVCELGGDKLYRPPWWP